MAIQDPVEAPRVLLLKNYPSASPFDTLMLDSFLTNIQNTIPNAQVDICCIANGEQIPNLSNYSLVILSGGKVNLLEDEKPIWVLQALDMVRNIAKEPGTSPKLLGICWGHQAIHYALEGDLAWVEDGPRIGVQDIQLTASGQKVFKNDTLKIHKYHVRCVSKLAAGFLPLAQDNEISLSESDCILTFQGHPEMTYEISKTLSEGDTGAYKPKATASELVQDVSTPHDGSEIWKVIMSWAIEGQSRTGDFESQ